MYTYPSHLFYLHVYIFILLQWIILYLLPYNPDIHLLNVQRPEEEIINLAAKVKKVWEVCYLCLPRIISPLHL